MKKQFLRRTALLASVLAGMIFCNSQAFSSPITNTANDGFEDRADGSIFGYYQNSGELMYVANYNNDGINFNNGTIEMDVEDWLISQSMLTDADRAGFVLTQAAVTHTNYNVDGTLAGGASNSGTWQTVPVNGVFPLISFYAVKASDSHAMYLVNPADSSGSWSTFDLWAAGHPGESLEISHFNGYNGTLPPPPEVPEPATMLLFGSGLAGLAGLTRRKMQ